MAVGRRLLDLGGTTHNNCKNNSTGLPITNFVLLYNSQYFAKSHKNGP